MYGHVSVYGIDGKRPKMAYASQSAFITTGTILDNILFGLPYDEEKVQRVIRACALTSDIEIWPQGLATKVVERGSNLSGGQRARVSLARACYADADVYILDHPLSAVDPKSAVFSLKSASRAF